MQLIELIDRYQENQLLSTESLKGGPQKKVAEMSPEEKLEFSSAQRSVFQEESLQNIKNRRSALYFSFLIIFISLLLVIVLIILYREDKVFVAGLCCGEGALLAFLINKSVGILTELENSNLLHQAAVIVKSETDFKEYLKIIKLKITKSTSKK